MLQRVESNCDPVVVLHNRDRQQTKQQAVAKDNVCAWVYGADRELIHLNLATTTKHTYYLGLARAGYLSTTVVATEMWL